MDEFLERLKNEYIERGFTFNDAIRFTFVNGKRLYNDFKNININEGGESITLDEYFNGPFDELFEIEDGYHDE